jgi:hypothetical protein
MADVDMTDAPATAPTSTSVTKKKAGAAAADGDSKGEGKKRFEVKKVGIGPRKLALTKVADRLTVECRSTLGLGYCGG